MFFAFVHKGYELFTNMFRQNNKGQIESCINEDIYKMIAEQYCNSDTEALDKEIDDLLKGIRKVHHFDDIKAVNKKSVTENLVNRVLGDDTYFAMPT